MGVAGGEVKGGWGDVVVHVECRDGIEPAAPTWAGGVAGRRGPWGNHMGVRI